MKCLVCSAATTSKTGLCKECRDDAKLLASEAAVQGMVLSKEEIIEMLKENRVEEPVKEESEESMAQPIRDNALDDIKEEITMYHGFEMVGGKLVATRRLLDRVLTSPKYTEFTQDMADKIRFTRMAQAREIADKFSLCTTCLFRGIVAKRVVEVDGKKVCHSHTQPKNYRMVDAKKSTIKADFSKIAKLATALLFKAKGDDVTALYPEFKFAVSQKGVFVFDPTSKLEVAYLSLVSGNGTLRKLFKAKIDGKWYGVIISRFNGDVGTSLAVSGLVEVNQKTLAPITK